MKKDIDKESLNEVIHTSKKILKVFYFLLIAVGIYVMIRLLKELKIIDIVLSILSILAPLFIGIFIAWLLNPFIKWLERKNVRRSIGIIFSYILLLLCILLLVKAIIPLLYNQTIELVDNLPKIMSNLKNWLENILGNMQSKIINVETIESNVFAHLDNFSNNISTTLPSLILKVLTVTISSIGTFLVGLVIGFFLLFSCGNLTSDLLEFVPKKYRKGVRELGKKINQSLRNYVSGAALDALLVFIVSTIVFAIVGLKAPLLFGLFCGLTNVIPYAGPYIGGIPACIVGFSQGTGIGIAVLISIFVIQMIEGNVLQTLIISKTTKLNPVTIILGLLVFGHFFGIIGMLLSTPIIGVIKVIIKYFDDKFDILNFS